MQGRRRAAIATAGVAGAFVVMIAGPAAASANSALTGTTTAVYVQAGGGSAEQAAQAEVGHWPVAAARAAYYAGRAAYSGFKAASQPRAAGEVTRAAGIGFPFATTTGKRAAVVNAERAFDR